MHKLSYVHVLIPEKDERSGTRPDRLAICEIAFLIYEYSFGTLMLRQAICFHILSAAAFTGVPEGKGRVGWYFAEDGAIY